MNPNLAFLDPLIPKQNSSIKRTGDEGFTSRTQAKRDNSMWNKKKKKLTPTRLGQASPVKEEEWKNGKPVVMSFEVAQILVIVQREKAQRV